MEIIHPSIDQSAKNTHRYFKEVFNASTENNCVAGGVRFIYELMKNPADQFSQLFNNAFLIKSYAGKEKFFDRRVVFDTGAVVQTKDGFFHSIFFGGKDQVVQISPDIKTMMEDFRINKPGPWPDSDIVEILYKQIKKPGIKPYRSPFEKIADDEDYPYSCKSEIIYLDAIVKRDGETTIKPYSEIFSKSK